MAGELAGLTGKALDLFLFAGDEHRMTYWVDPKTGEAKLTAVDGQSVRFGMEKIT